MISLCLSFTQFYIILYAKLIYETLSEEAKEKNYDVDILVN